MGIQSILTSVFKHYPVESRKEYTQNPFAYQLRHDLPKELQQLVAGEGDRYKTKGSAGMSGLWSDCPWIAIFDTLVTTKAQSGYYLVYIFNKDMSGVYLTLNMGVTEIQQTYRQKVKDVLLNLARDYRHRLFQSEKELQKSRDYTPMQLGSTNSLPLMYEKGNVLAIEYSANSLPSEGTLRQDLERFLMYYKKLVYSFDFPDETDKDKSETVEEKKKRRIHESFERGAGIAKKVKSKKGYNCEACDLVFTDRYGQVGHEFIEAHHLKPFSSLNEGKIELNIHKDFAVLCSNCHRMIHRLMKINPHRDNLNELREIIDQNRKRGLVKK